MRVYVIGGCQNVYQLKRLKNFVESRKGEILNLDLIIGDYPNLSLMQKSNEVWAFSLYWLSELEQEEKAKELRLKIRYFKINQTGRYVGRGKEVERDVLS